ncbi:MAG: DUF4340 domain-containing protein [Gammaproteobacteria bacterium]|nr:DUF4340 domain-containing protein [Gammaproteobacteria bacterium]
MNSNTLRLISLVVVGLLIALFLIESDDDSQVTDTGALLLPGMRAVANDINDIKIVRSGQEPVTLVRESGQWRLPSRSDYPADIAVVRAVLLAMANAKAIEAKTANPELHARLGLDQPSLESGGGVQVTATAGNDVFSLIFGNVAQTSLRYARIADTAESWLIDQNPDLPDSVGAWLIADIIDIDASRIAKVTIRHQDGEVIRINKTSQEASDFEVADLPEGRELSYPSVANGIGGILDDLDLEDVRMSTDTGTATGAVFAEFKTFDDVTVVAHTSKTGTGNWVSLKVTAADADNEEASEITARVAGWEYRITDYKAGLLSRRWDDILKEPTIEG